MMGNMNNSMNGSMNRMGGTSKDALLMAVNQAGLLVLDRRPVAMGRRRLLMWIYEKRLEFPVNIKEPNAKMAMFIMSQYGGLDCKNS